MKCILGYKLTMTQTFTKEGNAVPITRIQAGPCVVTQVKTVEKDTYSAVQLGFGKEKKHNKALTGHLKGVKNVRHLHEFRTEKDNKYERGQSVDVSIFEPGEKIDVSGVTKGRGYQGVVKRHKFAGGKKSHGHKDQLRMPGAIGSVFPQKVFKGKRMAGHMGDENFTVKNLVVISVDKEKNILAVKGAVPGVTNGLLKISTH